ncbi:galactosyltransferase-related protein [uncultured Nonlabens sp.]|uniref:glycosyltransferase family 2 protein n=1 Tax=uncultured Nonlabens sp. TaxID=859306 RepID=UPI002603E7A9|nr:galactosyltransferase-related protein [uncultured Nonlabens sp.]
MNNSLTIVIPNRNRDLKTVQRSVSSIIPQLDESTQLVIVDYGSEKSYQAALEQLLKTHDQVELVKCPTQGQLWNKSRCINMVLKSCKTTHLMVSDMDMIWHPEFIKSQVKSFSQNDTVYFTVGIMTEEESSLEKSFEDYKIKFQTDHEATGISIFPTEQLVNINGFDEFYHGWGSEDTDVHMRLKNAGYEVRFCESKIFFKHQWHEKSYRSSSSRLPFHSNQERVNFNYFSISKKTQKVKANNFKLWGLPFHSKCYKALEKPSQSFEIYATQEELLAFLFYLNDVEISQVVHLKVVEHPQVKSLKSLMKKATGKKVPNFINLEKVNEILLEAIIKSYHNSPYTFKFDRSNKFIQWTVNLINR